MKIDFFARAIAAEQLILASDELDWEEYKEKNKMTKILDAMYQEIKKHGLEDNIHIIKYFTNNKNDEVKLWFATKLLVFDEKYALKIIKTLKKNEGLVSLNAELVLDMWKRNELKL